MIKVPILKPQFILIQPADDLSMILSEITKHILHGVEFHGILQLLDGKLTADQIVEKAQGTVCSEILYYKLMQLEERNFIEEAGRKHSSTELLMEVIGGKELPEVQPTVSGSTVRLVFLGKCPEDAISNSLENAGMVLMNTGNWRDTVYESHDVPWLVVVDDYLNTDLEMFNKLAVSDKRQWILYKPVGARILIGPHFIPGHSPCWNCLATMLKGHRYEEAMINRGMKKYVPLRLSRGWSNKSLAIAASHLQKELDKFRNIHEEEECFITSFDLTDNGEQKHILRRLKGCSICSSISLYNGISSMKPLVLQPEKKYPDVENGSRIRSASETLQYLEKYKSRISSVIGKVVEFNPHANVYGRQFQATYSAGRTMECFRLDRADRFGVSFGKGLTQEQAKVSAMAEATERYCARFRKSDTTYNASLLEIKGEGIPLDDLVMLSKKQKDIFSRKCVQQGLTNSFNSATVIDWSPAWSLSKNQWKQVPALTAYYPFPKDREYLVPAWTTNGLSAGSTMEEAILQGLLEIVERDAFTIWWYNRLIPTGIDIDSFKNPEASIMAEKLDAKGWDLHLLDLTTDLGIPVIAAMGINREDPGRDPVSGFGANLDPHIALSRALGEMVSEWKSSPNIYNMNENSKVYLGKLFTELDFVKPDPSAALLHASTMNVAKSDYLLDDITKITEILSEKGMETLLVDLSRSEAPLKVVRVLVTGMRQVLPHFGPGRLFDVPVLTGDLTEALSVEEMNPMPFWNLLNRVNPASLTV